MRIRPAPATVPAGQEDGVQVWLLRLGHSEDTSIRHGAAHAGLDEVLSRGLGVPPGTLRLRRGAYGKPALVHEAPPGGHLRFNLSHSGDVALIAVAVGREVGIDVERVRRSRRVDRVARRCLSSRERAELARLPDDERTVVFYRYWTAKEAYAKATGRGLSSPFREIELRLDERGRDHVVHDHREPRRFTVRELRAPPGYVAALAVEA